MNEPANRANTGLNVVVTHGNGIPSHGMLDRIAALQSSMGKSHARIAAAILADPSSLLSQSVTEFAEGANTSAATVVRFAKKLGFRGYQHMKISVAHDIGGQEPLTLGPTNRDTPPAALLAASIEASVASVSGILSTLDSRAFGDALQALDKAQRVLVCGVGSSAGIAQDAGYRLTAIGLPVDSPIENHMQLLKARLLTPRSALVAISYSGATSETIESVEAANDQGATTIAITGHLRSPMTEVAQIVLVTGTPKGFAIRGEAMASPLPMAALVDALSVGLVLANEARATAALDAVDAVAAKHRA